MYDRFQNHEASLGPTPAAEGFDTAGLQHVGELSVSPQNADVPSHAARTWGENLYLESSGPAGIAAADDDGIEAGTSNTAKEPPSMETANVSPEPEAVPNVNPPARVSLYEVVREFNPPGKEAWMATHDVPEILDAHLDDILARLPRIPSLPRADELPSLFNEHRFEPIILEQPVTIADLNQHLSHATPDTPEMRVNIFGDVYTLSIGEVEGMGGDLLWKALVTRASLDFHTHPNPLAGDLLPSVEDITIANRISFPFLIGSSQGMMLSPRLEGKMGKKMWAEFVAARGFDKASFEAYGPDKIYDEFIKQVVHPTFVNWDELDGSMTLQKAADYLAGVRQTQQRE